MNKVLISGRTTADIELKVTQKGTSVASFTVAVDFGYGENKQTAFLDVIAWNKQAENASKFVHKGDRIIVDGRLQTRNWEDNNGNKRKAVEIVANEIEFIETKKTEASYQPIPSGANMQEVGDDEELPF